MENYNKYNNIMETEYTNISYAGIDTQMTDMSHQINQPVPEDVEMHSNLDPNIEKNIVYASRETIIANNHTVPVQITTYVHPVEEAIIFDVNSMMAQTANQPVQYEPPTTNCQNNEHDTNIGTNETVEEQLPLAVKDQLPLAVEEQLPLAVEEELTLAVEQLPLAVEEQLPLAVEEQLPLPVEAEPDLVPETVSIKHTEVEESEEIEQEEQVDEQAIEESEINKEEEKPVIAEEINQKDISKEEEIDREQCRVCMSKEDLVDIFTYEDSTRISDKIMTICTTVRIIEKDFLPHFICGACINKLRIALEFKATCENTDKEMRKKLKRSKNKIRRATEFILIDCDEFSDSNSEDEVKKNDDEEFHLSEEVESEVDSDSSFSSSEKKKKAPKQKKRTPKRRGKKNSGSSSNKRARKSVDSLAFDSKKSRRANVVYIKANESDFEDEKPRSKKRTSTDKNDDDIRDHKKSHNNKTLICPVCQKTFKHKISLDSHVQRHKENDLMCHICNKIFSSKIEFRKHRQNVHGEETDTLACEKCKRTFVSETRLNKHKQSKCPSSDFVASNPSRKQRNDDLAACFGRDLFKSVAPMTTTYWSDSFSD